MSTGDLLRCQCTAHSHSCHDPVTQEDLLCDHCRAGCILVGDGTYHVHVRLEISDDGTRLPGFEPRMQRVREHCTGEIMAWSPEFWSGPEGIAAVAAAQREGAR
jgi:hypothetical protein